MCWWELGQVIIRFPAQDPAAGPGIVWIQHFKFGLTRGPSPSSLHMVLRVSVCSTREYDKGPSFLPVVLPGAWYANEWNQVQTNTDQFFWQQMQCKEFVCRLCSHHSASVRSAVFRAELAAAWSDRKSSVIIKWVLSLFSQFYIASGGRAVTACCNKTGFNYNFGNDPKRSVKLRIMI